MKTFLSLLPFIFLAQGSYAQEQSTPPQTAKTTPKIIKASSGAAPTGQHRPRHVTPYPPSGQAYFQRPARWEYCIFEIRIRESEIGGGVFQLHMPGRSSGRNKDLGKIFREVHMQVQKTSRIDEVNALNTLGSMGWELTSTQKKEGRTGISAFYYFKRRI